MNGMGMRPGVIILREGTDTSQVRVRIVDIGLMARCIWVHLAICHGPGLITTQSNHYVYLSTPLPSNREHLNWLVISTLVKR